ncbi:hypothetical protein ACQZ61_21565 [Agrobacterium vitis]|uniref:hypothetical protein n=1 Tax=Agrobacterium vitis TaxID=373 RepID=UPI0008DC1949|nr:hypothetical protein [Agrobacterium vitis]MCF1455345.1 hypothetical protein [Agrobacterium vitis]MUO30984.1 hypothetical protein [Agrobacterium vitis]MUO85192.1 hypothetical protein [Agrobacterium vitis]
MPNEREQVERPILPAIVLLVDSNFLRCPSLRSFLAASLDHAIALDHLVLFEIFKCNPATTGQESLSIAAEFADQVYVIKPTHRWLDAVVTSDQDVAYLVDLEATVALKALCANLFNSPLPEAVTAELETRHAEAKAYIDRLGQEMIEYETALREKAKSFTTRQLTEIRTGSGISDETRAKVSELLHEITGHFILSYQEPGRTEPLPTTTARNMFAFRYALCVVLFYLEWVHLGRTTKKPAKRLNDIIDLQIASVSTFFSGIASNDILTMNVAKQATAILAHWGAFIRFADK